MESRDAYFDRVYEEASAQVKKYIVVRIRSAADMEDVFQETWRRFYERTALLRPNEPIRYLTAIAKSELARRYRNIGRQREREASLEETLPDTDAPLEERVLIKLTASDVWEAVKTEPLLSYQAFVLHYGFDLPVREIAHTLGISENAVKLRLSRTRTRIRTQQKGASEQ